MPKSISKITETKKQKVNLAMTYHTQIGALITESTRTLRSQEAAVERAQNRLNESTKSFNAQMHEAGAQSRDFKKATASCEEVYDFYRTCVVNALPMARLLTGGLKRRVRRRPKPQRVKVARSRNWQNPARQLKPIRYYHQQSAIRD